MKQVYMEEGRTFDYLINRACERFGILPPGAKPAWEEMNGWEQLNLLAYEQVRQYEAWDQD